jgi:hypothetical protein
MVIWCRLCLTRLILARSWPVPGLGFVFPRFFSSGAEEGNDSGLFLGRGFSTKDQCFVLSTFVALSALGLLPAGIPDNGVMELPSLQKITF